MRGTSCVGLVPTISKIQLCMIGLKKGLSYRSTIRNMNRQFLAFHDVSCNEGTLK
jgi:hypothetical protein